MKTGRFYLLALVVAMIGLPMIFTSCQKEDGTSEQSTKIRYHFATKEEGRQLKLANTDYFNALTQNDIDWKMESLGKSIEDFKEKAAAQIQDFTDEEKKAISKVMDFIEARCNELGICLPLKDEIVFIKSDMEDEGNAGGYTHRNEIYLSSFVTNRTARAFAGDPQYDADYCEYRIWIAREIVSHEMFHCLTRGDARFRQLMYSLVGFTVTDHEIEFGPTVRNLLMQNPDIERFDEYATFTVNGTGRPCILIATYSSSYADAVASNPNATMFEYFRNVLVPIDDPNTMIPIEEASNLYDLMGRNTGYLMGAEECMADNFSYLITYGFYGRYDHDWQKGVFFIPYKTPQLIRNIHNTLLENYSIK